MADENVLARWSRRALEARRAPPASQPESTAEEGAGPVLPDPATLDGASDYTAFMRQQVPAALRKAALRQAWVTDEAIAGFRGMAEYDWDFHAPGMLDPIPPEEALRLLAAVLPPPPAPDPTPEEDEQDDAAGA